MISHLKIRHAETDLRQHISKMNETLSGIVWDNILDVLKPAKTEAVASISFDDDEKRLLDHGW